MSNIFFFQCFFLQKRLISFQLFLRQSGLSININLPIGKLLVLINQSFCGYSIDGKQLYFVYNFFGRTEKTNRAMTR